MTSTDDQRACPHCGRINEAHDGPTRDATPKPGDVSLCWGCGGVGIFTETGVRKPTPDEAAELEAAPKVKAAQAAIRESFTPSQASTLRWGAR